MRFLIVLIIVAFAAVIIGIYLRSRPKKMDLSEDEKFFDEFVRKVNSKEKIFRPLPNPLETRRNFFRDYIAGNQEELSRIRPFPGIFIDFVEAGSVNAFAWNYKDRYLIGVNNSDFILLRDLFIRMMCYKEILPKIGNSSIEISPTEKTNYFKDLSLLDPNKLPALPKDPERLKHAIFFTDLALLYIFQHETAHIINGHVDYLKGLHHPRLDEVDNCRSQVFNEQKLERQTLEWDADVSAVITTAKYCNNVSKGSEDPLYKDIYSVLADLFFAIYNVMKLFGDNYKQVNLGEGNYPSTVNRQYVLFITFKNLGQILGVDSTCLEDLVLERMRESEDAYELITGKPLNPEPYSDLYFKDNPYPKGVYDKWEQTLRNELLKHSFVQLQSLDRSK